MSGDKQSEEQFRKEKSLSGYQPPLHKEEEHGGMQPYIKGNPAAAQLAKDGHADFSSPPTQPKSVDDKKETGA